MVDRDEIYMHSGELLKGVQHAVNDILFHLRNTDVQVSSPMVKIIEKYEYMNFQLSAILFTVVFFLFLIDAILIYSMMLTDIEERTYEFAMLRTLGFKKSSLVMLLVVQALFFSLPATLIGFILLYIFTQAA